MTTRRTNPPKDTATRMLRHGPVAAPRHFGRRRGSPTHPREGISPSAKRDPAHLAVFVAVSLLALPRLGHATVPSDLCTGNPCTVTGTKTADANDTLDFGATTDLVLETGATLKIGPSAVLPRPLTLRARSITLEASARILGDGDDGEVILEATGGSVTMLGTGGSAARIDVASASAGIVDITATGDITLGPIDANGTGIDSTGGSISLEAGGMISVTGMLNATGNGVSSVGGDISIIAGTGVTLGGILDTSAATDAGAIFVSSANGPLSVLERISANGGDPDGFGGEIGLETGFGDITIDGPIFANGGAGVEEQCGDGGELTIESGRSVLIDANLTLKGGANCIGGTLDVLADTSITQAAGVALALDAQGPFGSGGILNLDAFGDLVVRGVDLAAPSFGGTSDIRSRRGQVTIAGLVNGRGTGAFSLPGAHMVRACSIVVLGSGGLDARGDLEFKGIGSNILTASDSITVAGDLRALTRNEIRMRAGSPNLTGSTIAPAATTSVEPAIPPCPAAPVCGNATVEPGELCDEGARNGTAAGCCAAGCASAKANGAACDDGVSCNGADTCAAAVCANHAGNPCAGATGECATTECSEATQCRRPVDTPCTDGDGNTCTEGACNADGTCVAAPRTGTCDDTDGNPCTDGECNAGGTCVPTPRSGTCDDGDENSCTDGECNASGTCVPTPVPDETSCEDGTFCNGEEICRNGTCRRRQLSCVGENCDEVGEVCEPFCGDGFADAGEACGEPGLPVCPTSQGCRNCACEGATAPGDAYLCFNTEVSEAPAWSFTPKTLSIVDRFESKRFDATLTGALCGPAVLGAPLGTYPPTTRDVMVFNHKIVQDTDGAPQSSFVRSDHSFTDTFGTVDLTLLRPLNTMLRASQSDFGPLVTCDEPGDCSDGDTCQSGVCLPDPAAAPAAAPPSNSAVPNFKCYKVGIQSGTPPFTIVPNIRISDHLGNTLLYDALKPTRVCSPAAIDGVNAAAPSRPGQLTCYKLRPSSSTPPQAAGTSHQVGLRTKDFGEAYLDLIKGRELCVPSFVDLP